MLTLILMRHAKSGWDDPGAEDRDRTLSDRGRGDAPRIGRWLATRGHLPDLVLCSTARRTAETMELILAEMPSRPETVFRDRLYHASADTILAELRGAKSSTVAMIGHNPGIGDFAGRMVRQAPDHPRFADYPTAATCVMAFESERWADVRPGTGRVVEFVVPGDLP